MCEEKESYKLDQDRKEFSSLELEGGKRVGGPDSEEMKVVDDDTMPEKIVKKRKGV